MESYFAVFLKKLKKMGIFNQLTISQGYEYINNIIKMSYLEFEKIIQCLENENYLHVDRAAGLENITIDTRKYSEDEIIKKILESELVE